mgnify:CR=1 FL=1
MNFKTLQMVIKTSEDNKKNMINLKRYEMSIVFCKL